ncbi:hypothetical protein YPPY13_3717 [Yersinia pestis PY-13]|uniref:Uncharacterized protein n=3 Tax=Yersinia pseudotuberculosis complex TaxID=1649845 RepID=A0A0U1QXT6_YERP3|nr:hypothetical protein YpsIP31758_3176 [Yersinia pseudotuberculosis IP 31758]ABX86099.1 hypothetical protein YpAngola_A3326 [Yersinia pestis Angola]ADW00010.1 hypothetical protein YPC_3545 [Yersinia pestis biovar Medievalis str. Harbin 35]AEL72595.1 hypothetical protein A1122_09740 [Yersinia pestis A1122]EDR34835.1 hypothetical protein YPIP275_3704 [Yersinia pestis biovar Orientalis str. IP275]EDR38791.1 hypothetical protein YpF1991016_3181 [Yersinia pestis biovar Orientalis str. F1991016]ED
MAIAISHKETPNKNRGNASKNNNKYYYLALAHTVIIN